MILSRHIRRAATAALATLALAAGLGITAAPAYADPGTPDVTVIADLNDATGGQIGTIPRPHTASFSGMYSVTSATRTTRETATTSSTVG